MPPIALILVIVIGVALVVRLAAGGLDHDRVRRYFEERGGKLLSIHWEPFGPGWFGERNARIYRIEFRDADGEVHRARCKTSAFAGVYVTEDSLAEPMSRGERAEVERLREENRRLRDELRARVDEMNPR